MLMSYYIQATGVGARKLWRDRKALSVEDNSKKNEISLSKTIFTFLKTAELITKTKTVVSYAVNLS